MWLHIAVKRRGSLRGRPPLGLVKPGRGSGAPRNNNAEKTAKETGRTEEKLERGRINCIISDFVRFENLL